LNELVRLLSESLYKVITVYVESYLPKGLIFHGVLFKISENIISLIIVQNIPPEKKVLINFNKLFYPKQSYISRTNHLIVEIPLEKIEAVRLYTL
jgi:hypothetical protein